MARLVGSADQMGILDVKGVMAVMEVMAVPGKVMGYPWLLEGLEGARRGKKRTKSTKID